jgi:hypothetical protein
MAISGARIDPSKPNDGSSSLRFGLQEMLRWRSVPLAGLFVVVSAKCPLLCAHCSVESLMRSPDSSEGELTKFLESIGPNGPLKYVLFTGGEPLLFPRRVEKLIEALKPSGVGTSMLTGLFFAQRGDGTPPKSMWKALDQIGHLTVSLDKFHEVQVPHSQVMRFLKWGLNRGMRLSVQVTHVAGDDYGQRAAAEVHEVFSGEVEVFEGSLRPLGRGAALGHASAGSVTDEPRGCSVLSWPVVRVDGQVVRCCSYEATESAVPAAHLKMGNITSDSWDDLCSIFLEPPIIPAIRACGPLFTQQRILDRADNSGGYCTSCSKYSEQENDQDILRSFNSRPMMLYVHEYLGMPRESESSEVE